MVWFCGLSLRGTFHFSNPFTTFALKGHQKENPCGAPPKGTSHLILQHQTTKPLSQDCLIAASHGKDLEAVADALVAQKLAAPGRAELWGFGLGVGGGHRKIVPRPTSLNTQPAKHVGFRCWLCKKLARLSCLNAMKSAVVQFWSSTRRENPQNHSFADLLFKHPETGLVLF